MTLASQQLFALAELIAVPYFQLPNIRAAMVTGSVAKGIADTYSDIDMGFFYETTLPEEAALEAIRSRLGVSDRKWLSGSRDDGSFAEAYDLGGVEVQLIHSTIAAWAATMAELQRDLKVDTPLAKALEGIMICRPLYGAEYIDAWKAQAANFPPPLAEAMIRHFMAFFPAWGLMPYLEGRDATVWYHHILVESVHHLLGVLAGLNNVYFTPFQFKRTQHFIAQLALAPARLGERIEGLFQTLPALSLPELERLVDETLALVEQHMPQIDTTAARRRIGWRRPPWRAEDFAALISGQNVPSAQPEGMGKN